MTRKNSRQGEKPMSNALWNEDPLFPHLENFRRLNGRNKNEFIIADTPQPDGWREVFLARIFGLRNSCSGSMYPPSQRELHPQGFIILSLVGNTFQACDFDIQTEAINGKRRF